MNIRRFNGVAAAGALVVLSGSGVAFANADSATVSTRVESWYVTCKAPADCSLLPVGRAYPENTLHVGVTAGQPVAATYIELALPSTPDATQLVGGRLTLPVDTAPTDGSAAPETASIVVCAVTGLVEAAHGSTEEPPDTNCDAASAKAQYTAEPKPTFTVDLAAFTARWSEGDVPALAVLPAPDAQPQATWHVAFWGKNNTSEGAIPINAHLEFSAAPDGGDADADPRNGDFDYGSSESFDPGSSPLDAAASFDSYSAPAPVHMPALEQDLVAEEPIVAPVEPIVAAPKTRTVLYAYPAAWLVPLALVAGFLITGRTLTKKLDPIGW